MSEENKNPPRPEEEPPDSEEIFDRQAYLKEVRMNILKNLDLPEDTKPEQVSRLLEIKTAIKRKKGL